jgi:hypothetical protein
MKMSREKSETVHTGLYKTKGYVTAAVTPKACITHCEADPEGFVCNAKTENENSCGTNHARDHDRRQSIFRLTKRRHVEQGFA